MGDDFVCAICERRVEMRWNRLGADETIPPLCLYCECTFGRGYRRMGASGSLRDRRIVRQGLALAEALSGHAHAKEWESRHGRS